MKILVPRTKTDLQTLFRNSYMTTLSLKMNIYDILLEGNETPTFYVLAKTHKIFAKLPPFQPI